MPGQPGASTKLPSGVVQKWFPARPSRKNLIVGSRLMPINITTKTHAMRVEVAGQPREIGEALRANGKDAAPVHVVQVKVDSVKRQLVLPEALPTARTSAASRYPHREW